MLFLTSGVDKYIIDKDDDELIQVSSAYSIHQLHENYRRIGQSEWHHHELIVSVTSSEGCLWNILL